MNAIDGVTDDLAALEPGKAVELLEREFPCWRTWIAHGLCHALPRSRPALLVHGEDPAGLRDQIIRAESFRDGL